MREVAQKKGWRLPSFANYRQTLGFRYEGVNKVRDELNPDDTPTITRKKALKTQGEFDYEEEVDSYNISPYLTSENPHPLPDTGKQQSMMKATQSWSREGPLLPKEPMETPRELNTSVRGKNAQKKLEDYYTNKIERDSQREYDHRILRVRTGPKQYQWALFVGHQKIEKGKSGFSRTSKRVRVKGGRDLRIADIEAVENVKCPTCNKNPTEKCVNKKGQTLDYVKTHVSRIKLYIVEMKGEKWSKRSEFDSPSMGGYRGDTGI